MRKLHCEGHCDGYQEKWVSWTNHIILCLNFRKEISLNIISRRFCVDFVLGPLFSSNSISNSYIWCDGKAHSSATK